MVCMETDVNRDSAVFARIFRQARFPNYNNTGSISAKRDINFRVFLELAQGSSTNIHHRR